MHGMGGADSFGGVDYFLGVPDELGGAGLVVEAPGVSPFATSLQRALEWEAELDALLARGHRRVNLIGHSQGGTDARVLASDAGLARGDVVASVTTIGTPHRGTAVADLIATGIVDGVIQPWALDLGASVFVELFGLDVADPALAGQIAQLTPPVSVALDAATPDHEGTAYWSWAGRSCGVLEPLCQDQHEGEIVGGLLAATYLILWPAPNDGMVPVESQHHGVVLGEIPADHANEIGQFDDQVPDPFDHLGFYRAEAARLRDAGL
jgi:triacylglycerol lipase